jgi:hypothetical protein
MVELIKGSSPEIQKLGKKTCRDIQSGERNLNLEDVI